LRQDLADALAAISDIADELSLKFQLQPPNSWFPGSLSVLEEQAGAYTRSHFSST
jgi:serine palmitoyltransferase